MRLTCPRLAARTDHSHGLMGVRLARFAGRDGGRADWCSRRPSLGHDAGDPRTSGARSEFEPAGHFGSHRRRSGYPQRPLSSMAQFALSAQQGLTGINHTLKHIMKLLSLAILRVAAAALSLASLSPSSSAADPNPATMSAKDLSGSLSALQEGT